MREFPLSNCEKNFLQRSFLENQRTDGRRCDQYRRIALHLGKDRGSCLAELGDTAVLCHVSCQLVEPKQSRPTEGVVHVNLELSTMAAPQFESGRYGEVGIELVRLLERSIKESRCIDTEALCVLAGEKVWQVRVDVHILNHDGSLVDCASLAAITALIHFRRPDVTVCGTEFTVHSLTERQPVPLSIYHYPVCVTFGFTERGQCYVVDPNCREEKVLEGRMVVAVNSHREVCTLHCTGSMMVKKEQVLRYTNEAVERAIELTDLVKKTIAKDEEERKPPRKPVGFSSMISDDVVTMHQYQVQHSLACTVLPSTSDAEAGASVRNDKVDKPEFRINGTSVHSLNVEKPLMTEFESSATSNRFAVLSELDSKKSKKSKKVKTEPLLVIKDEMEDLSIGPPLVENQNKKNSGEKMKSRRRKLGAGKVKQEVLDPTVDELLDDIEQDVIVLQGSHLDS